jgi:hypothetical protein
MSINISIQTLLDRLIEKGGAIVSIPAEGILDIEYIATDQHGRLFALKSKEIVDLEKRMASKSILYRKALMRLVGASDKEELTGMKEFFNAKENSVIPVDERDNMINAINVLLEDI